MSSTTPSATDPSGEVSSSVFGGVRNRLGMGTYASPHAARSAAGGAASAADCDADCEASVASTSAMSDAFYPDSYHGGGVRSKQPRRTFSPAGGDAPMGASTMNGGIDAADGDPGSNSAGAGAAKKLGTINGVFLPCLQTILGVILFLRLTSITAQAGVLQTTLIILICVASTLLTALSLSAIATNGTICAGGPYYVISRTLGVEIGGALGLLFYLGNTVAASMYVLGAIEALASSPHFGTGHLFPGDAQAASLLLMFLLACVVNVGVRYVNVTSNLFLGMVFLSIFCMCLGCILFAAGTPFTGRLNPWDRVFLDNIWPAYEPDPVTEITPTFFGLLAIFYPSVTGILAGSNRSAVLADPGRSIPRGTISAIGATTAVYLFVVWLFGLTVSNRTLKTDKFVVSSVAFPTDSVVKVGVVLSCVGAALQCLAGAPRLLQAIAMDGTMPMLRSLQPKPGDMDVASTPRKAVWITWFIASVPTLAGNLDHITPIVTMFYLLMYSGINLSTFFLGILKSPGFRPTFRYFHWSVSLLGFVWCLGLALVISWYTALLALGLFSLLYVYNRRQKSQKDWGDVGDGIRYNVVTSLLRDLAGTTAEQVHAKNWRPQLLTVVDTDDCGNPADLWVLSLAGQLKKGRGINMVASVVRRHPSVKGAGGGTGASNGVGVVNKDADANGAASMDLSGFDDWETCELVANCKSLLQRRMKLERMDGFAEVSATSSKAGTREAVWSAVVHSGLGPLSPNTVMLSYPSVFRRSSARSAGVANFEDDYLSALRGIMNLRKAVILFRGCDRYPYGTDVVSNASIDVWWVVHDGGLLLLLPFILSKNGVWGKSGARLRLFAVVTAPTENPERLREAVTEHLSMVRIAAEVSIVDMSDSTIAEDMRETDGAACPDANGGMPKDRNTHDRTVGEVFSHATYDVPYHAIVPMDDVDDVEYGMGPYAMSNGGGGGAPGMVPRGPVDGRIDDDEDEDEAASRQNGGGGAKSSSFGSRARQKERMETAAAFNSHLRLHSSNAALVVTNLPLIRRGWPASDFFDYVDAMCDAVDNVLLVRGSGAEVITTYA